MGPRTPRGSYPQVMPNHSPFRQARAQHRPAALLRVGYAQLHRKTVAAQSLLMKLARRRTGCMLRSICGSDCGQALPDVQALAHRHTGCTLGSICGSNREQTLPDVQALVRCYTGCTLRSICGPLRERTLLSVQLAELRDRANARTRDYVSRGSERRARERTQEASTRRARVPKLGTRARMRRTAHLKMAQRPRTQMTPRPRPQMARRPRGRGGTATTHVRMTHLPRRRRHASPT